MGKQIDLSGCNDPAPVIKLNIADVEIELRVCFSLSCCKLMFRNHDEEGKDYRTSFAGAVFSMYQQKEGETVLTEDDFINTTDENLQLVLDCILEQDQRGKARFEESEIEDIYERFYCINETILQELINIMDQMRQTVIQPAKAIASSIVKNRKSFGESMKAIVTETIELLGAAIRASIESSRSAIVQYKEWEQAKETLLKYNWIYSSELPEDLVIDIYERHSTLTTADVDKIIIDYFRQNRCENLKNMVKTWKSLPCFVCRENIFHEALVHHSRKYYNSSVTLLAIHIEGIITDFVRVSLNTPRFGVKRAIKDTKEILEETQNITIYDYEVYSDVMEQIEELFNEHFDHEDPDSASNNSRHKIAHGHVYEAETEVNSLKHFLYLNELYNLLLAINEEIESTS